METLSRMVSRQWTDLSQKRNSKRLKSNLFDQQHTNNFEENNIFYDISPSDNFTMQKCPPVRNGEENLQFTSPFHLYEHNAGLGGGIEARKASDNNKIGLEFHEGSRINYGHLEIGQTNGELNCNGIGTDIDGGGSEKRIFAQFQQPLQKVLKVSSAIREKFPSSPRSSINNISGNMETNNLEAQGDEEENRKNKQIFGQFRKQANMAEVRNKLSGRKKKSDNQNLLMFEEMQADGRD